MRCAYFPLLLDFRHDALGAIHSQKQCPSYTRISILSMHAVNGVSIITYSRLILLFVSQQAFLGENEAREFSVWLWSVLGEIEKAEATAEGRKTAPINCSKYCTPESPN